MGEETKVRKKAGGKSAFSKELERAERTAIDQGYKVKTEVPVWLAGYVAGRAAPTRGKRKR
jgi:hypothetical protein